MNKHPKEVIEKIQNQAIDFEEMRDMAKLKALSKTSLERELSNNEYKNMMMLKNRFFPMSGVEFMKSLKRLK